MRHRNYRWLLLPVGATIAVAFGGPTWLMTEIFNAGIKLIAWIEKGDNPIAPRAASGGEGEEI